MPQESLSLRVKVQFSALAALPNIIARVRRVFDLDAQPVAIAAALSQDAMLAPLVAARPGLRVPGAWDGFEMAVRAVLGQQITVAWATRQAGQLVSALGRPLPQPAGALTHSFPLPEAFDASALWQLGMPQARLSALQALAQTVRAQPHLFDRHASLDEAIAHLRALPGIDEWSAHYIAMRAMRESDAFVATDVGLQRALAVAGQRPSAAAVLQRASAWRPWRAYAVMYLWNAEPQELLNHEVIA